MRTLVIGDIHGCDTAFNVVLERVALRPTDRLITLGDYVDRGPGSRQVLDRLLQLRQRHPLIPLLGNHEEMMLGARGNASCCAQWLNFGGRETLESYSAGNGSAALDDIPPPHWHFMESLCVPYFETDTHLFVHATLNPLLSLEEQTIDTLRWAKFRDPPPHFSGKIMVCGHTRQESGLPRNLGHAICLDTWAYGEGWLSCWDLQSDQLHQANQQGEYRVSTMAEHLQRD